MRTLHNSLTMAFGAMLFALAGCVPNQQYRTSFTLSSDPAAPPDTKAIIETHANYKLGFVEFDDQGSPWDKCQSIAVEEMIRTEARLPAVNSTLPQGIILVTFVHEECEEGHSRDTPASYNEHPPFGRQPVGWNVPILNS